MIINEKYFIYISIFILVLYLVFMIIGYKKGFIYELVSLIYTGLAILASWFVAPILGKLYPIIKLENIYEDASIVSKLINIDPIINTIAYFAIVFLVLKLFYVVLSLVLKSLNKIPVIGKLNQILGLLAGIFNATLVTLAISLLFTLPVFKNGKEIKEKTILLFVDKYTTEALSYALDNVELKHIEDVFDSIDIDAARLEFKQYLLNNNKNE